MPYAKLMTLMTPQSRDSQISCHGLPDGGFISLTIDEHRELGREMKATSQRMRELCKLVLSVYGPANRTSFSFLKAMDAIELLEQELATQAMQDLPGYPANDLYL